MASGHEYRANRPNTWLLRPMLQSEDSSCQPGAVHTWPKADIRKNAFAPSDVDHSVLILHGSNRLARPIWNGELWL